jgi:ribosomal protein S4
MTPKGTHLPKHPKLRLDELLVQRGGAPTIDQARRLIMAGEVLVNGQVMDKPGMPVPDGATVEVRSRLPYVSRGGLKLAAALDVVSPIASSSAAQPMSTPLMWATDSWPGSCAPIPG